MTHDVTSKEAVEGYLHFGIWPWQLAEIVKMEIAGTISHTAGKILLKKVLESNKKGQEALDKQNSMLP